MWQDGISPDEMLLFNDVSDEHARRVIMDTSDYRPLLRTPESLEPLAKPILQQYQRQQIQATCKATALAAQKPETNTDTLLTTALEDFSALQVTTTDEWLPAPTLARQAWQTLSEIAEANGKLLGLPTGLPSLDGALHGLRAGHLIVLAARPAMGKSSLARNIALHAALQGFPVGIVSLEMTAKEIIFYTICSYAKVSASSIYANTYNTQDMQELSAATQKINDLPLHVIDDSSLTIPRLRASARRLAKNKGAKLIIIDYMQLISSPIGAYSREREVAKISGALKNLAKELDIAILALSQLNRALEARTVKRPQLSDLRESGSIEQDADAVLLLHRPEYYDENATKGLADLILAKNRHGPVSTHHLTWIPEYTTFKDGAPADEWYK